MLADISAGRGNRFLPGVAIPKDLTVTGDLAQACKADALLLAVPAQVLHGFADGLKPHLRAGQPLVICAKGIEKGSGKLVTEVVATKPARCRAGDPVGTIFRARCGAWPAHRRHHRGKGRAGGQAAGVAGLAPPSAPMPATI